MDRFNHAYNYTPRLGAYEQPVGKSQTRQNDTMSIKEIMERYQQGLQPVEREPIYLDQEDIDKINHYYAPGALDLTDLSALKQHNEEMLAAVNDAIKKKEAAEKEAEDQKELERIKKQEAIDNLLKKQENEK